MQPRGSGEDAPQLTFGDADRVRRLSPAVQDARNEPLAAQAARIGGTFPLALAHLQLDSFAGHDGGEVYLPLYVQVDPEQDERPENDGEDRRQDAAPPVDVREVMMRCGDRYPDAEVNDTDETDAPASPHGRLVPRLWIRKRRLEELVLAAEDGGNRLVAEDVHDRLRQ